MVISRESDYAMRILRDLSHGGVRSAKDICGREQIPMQYAYKILKKLENNGFLAGYRGPKGGYELIKSPDSFTLYDIVIAVEETVYINECMKLGYACPRNTIGSRCEMHQELQRVQKKLVDSLNEKTFAEVLQ